MLVVALDGWVDAGMAASDRGDGARSRRIETQPYAVFDAEELIDQRARRPRLASSTG